ncbi:hypothetical protein IAD21_00048 [Abditibacteriota bacterium]|nr:hypothetical protein IAD21_00048 [Abditibacteriota bacterium]
MNFKINKPQVVHEVFDDEVVVVNLDTGNYYSLDGVGALIWRCLEAGSSTSEIVHTVNESYEGNEALIERAVNELVGELQQETLISASDGIAQTNGTESQDSSDVATSGAKVPFKTPVLTRFTDMQELLLLDPVHDVDATGWPSAKPGIVTGD